MSKTKQSYGMDFDDEASKLLEKALSSFDGIILGMAKNWWCLISMTKIHKPRTKIVIVFVGDHGAHQQQPSSNVLSAAQTLALSLQQCKNSTPSPPDKETSEIINAWLESFMPVSIFCCCNTCNRLSPSNRTRYRCVVLDKHSDRFAVSEVWDKVVQSISCYFRPKYLSTWTMTNGSRKQLRVYGNVF